MEVTDEPTVRSGSRFLYRHQLKLEALQPVVHVPTTFDVAASRARVRSGLDRRPDDVRVEDLRHQFQLARRPALVVEPCHGVHVLLRHRPTSIPRAKRGDFYAASGTARALARAHASLARMVRSAAWLEPRVLEHGRPALLPPYTR